MKVDLDTVEKSLQTYLEQFNYYKLQKSIQDCKKVLQTQLSIMSDSLQLHHYQSIEHSQARENKLVTM